MLPSVVSRDSRKPALSEPKVLLGRLPTGGPYPAVTLKAPNISLLCPGSGATNEGASKNFQNAGPHQPPGDVHRRALIVVTGTRGLGKLRKGVGLRYALFVLLALGAWHPAAAVQATLVADAHVSTAQPDVNSGTLSNLNVGGGYTTLVQFDLGVLPAGTTAAQITRATLRLYCNLATTPGAITVQPVNAAWGEYSVTYNTLPPLGAANGSLQVSAAGEFVTIDVTAAVQGWVSAPTTNNGLALTAASAVVQFDSKENDETSHAPELEIALAAGGAGSVGGQGPAGPAGPAGAQGMPGPQGLIGPVGPAGAAGPAGPSGAGAFAFQGAYSSSTNYSHGDVVSFGGSSFISLQDANHGNTPSSSPSAWGTLASAGTSSPGPAGPTGSQGPAGPAGSPGLVYQGAYDSTTTYALGDVVLFNGASWVSLLAGNHGQTPGLNPSSLGNVDGAGTRGRLRPAGPGWANRRNRTPRPRRSARRNGRSRIAGCARAGRSPGVDRSRRACRSAGCFRPARPRWTHRAELPGRVRPGA